MAIAVPNPLIPQLAEAMGLNPRKCRSIRLNISTDNAVTADVNEYIDEGQLEKVIQCFTPREYVLVPRDAARWVPVSERLPEVDARVLVAYDIGYRRRRGVATGSRVTGGTKPYWNVEEIDPRCTEVTAWMLLPEEPPR